MLPVLVGLCTHWVGWSLVCVFFHAKPLSVASNVALVTTKQTNTKAVLTHTNPCLPRFTRSGSAAASFLLKLPSIKLQAGLSLQLLGLPQDLTAMGFVKTMWNPKAHVMFFSHKSRGFKLP